jgi:hypothetical protein
MPHLHLTVPQFLCAELVAAAALALWVVARYPARGPQSLRSAAGLAAVAYGLFQLATAALPLFTALPFGTYVAMFALVLPGYVAIFLASAWLLRVLAAAVGGSGGGGGHRVPLSSR